MNWNVREIASLCAALRLTVRCALPCDEAHPSPPALEPPACNATTTSSQVP